MALAYQRVLERPERMAATVPAARRTPFGRTPSGRAAVRRGVGGPRRTCRRTNARRQGARQTLAAGADSGATRRGQSHDGLRAAEAEAAGAAAACRRGREDRRRAHGVPGGWTIAAPVREHGVGRGAIRTAVADLMPAHTTVGHGHAPAPEPPVALDMTGGAAGFLRMAEPELAGPRSTTACPCGAARATPGA
ncbi:hypothetical protein [Streptomyces sp. H51]|uniref:hypothetical protein n=1 Tax=Streptomyces sp. H51 TaxID=3111770 RepID=UPI002D787B04|nr:hypothetical protein [Streptomyces sp. H51]